MRPKFIVINFFILSLIAVGLYGCFEYHDEEPLDIINGEVDLKQQYYKSKFKNPILLGGKISDKISKAALEGATITARVENSTTKYSTTSKSDGTYELYVEGMNTYVIYAEKSGFNKSYYFMSSNDSTTTIGNSGASSLNISLETYDPNMFKVNYLATKATLKYMNDIAFNGTYLVSAYDNSALAYQYDSDGTYVKSSPFKQYMEFFGCQDTVYWTGTSSFKTLYKVGQKGGKTLSSITCQTSASSYIDVEIYDNNIWLITSSQLYKLSLTGELLLTADLSTHITSAKLAGIAIKNKYLYLLNEEYDNSSNTTSYTLYKIDPATGKILTKGLMPDNLDNINLKGLAYDKYNFWTIKVSYSYYDDLVKFSTTE